MHYKGTRPSIAIDKTVKCNVTLYGFDSYEEKKKGLTNFVILLNFLQEANRKTTRLGETQ